MNHVLLLAVCILFSPPKLAGRPTFTTVDTTYQRLVLTYSPKGENAYDVCRKCRDVTLVFPAGYYGCNQRRTVFWPADYLEMDGKAIYMETRPKRPKFVYRGRDRHMLITTSVVEARRFIGNSKKGSYVFAGNDRLTERSLKTARPFIGLCSETRIEFGVLWGDAKTCERNIYHVAKKRHYKRFVWVDGGPSYALNHKLCSHLAVQ